MLCSFFKTPACLFAPPSESRCGRGSSDHHPRPWRSDRLLQALHVPRYLHYDQETHQIQTRRLFIPGPAGLRDLDVHRVCLHWRQCRPLPCQSIQSIWVARWGLRGGRGATDSHPSISLQRGAAGPDTSAAEHQPTESWADQWVWYLQLPLVLTGGLHAAGLWYFTTVRKWGYKFWCILSTVELSLFFFPKSEHLFERGGNWNSRFKVYKCNKQFEVVYLEIEQRTLSKFTINVTYCMLCCLSMN